MSRLTGGSKILAALLLLGLLGCGGDSDKKSEPRPQAKAKAAFSVQVPDSGPMPARVKKLWETTRPIIEADATAGYSEAEFQARRGVLYEAWVQIQVANSLDPNQSEAVGRLIPRILETINHVYGFPGFPEAKRQEKRRNTGRTRYLLKEIDQKVNQLP